MRRRTTDEDAKATTAQKPSTNMNFKEWMMHRGLSASTAEKYAGAISGPISDWGMNAGVLQGPLVAMESPAAYAHAASKIAQLPIFQDRNSRGHNMYSSALARFADYLEDGFSGEVAADMESVLLDSTTSSTEKIELIKARLGQGKFRQRVIHHWRVCAVTGYGELSMLVASHIKPWSESSSAERLDPFNGLLLIPNLDRAFDKGFITFDTNGRLLVSPQLPEVKALGILESSRVDLKPQNQPFMEYHRACVYRAK